jgi:RNA polymerase sigma factor (sigma-70 family)
VAGAHKHTGPTWICRVRQKASGGVEIDVTASASTAMTSDGESARNFDSVVVQDARRLYSLAFLILRDAGEAEDAVQETQLKAWRSWESLSRTDRPAAWLTRVCVNHCISRRRHLRSRGWPPIALTEESGASSDPAARADIVDVDRAYRQLSVKQRAAITLNYRHGYSVEECAVFMGCRPGTVRTHVARGLAALRKELGDA